MREKLLLIGSGGFGRVVLEHASQYFDCAFLDDGNLKTVDGVPVIGTTADIERLYGEYRYLLVTIGTLVPCTFTILSISKHFWWSV